MSQFREDYRAWLEDALADGVPTGVIGFTFNLYRQFGHDTRYGVEFVGAGEFNVDNSDWACAEVWEPAKGRNFSIPLTFSGETWEECLGRVKSMIASILSEETQLSTRLRSVNGIGIGFVDGELTLLWRA